MRISGGRFALALACSMMLASALSSTVARAESYAVLAVDAARDGGDLPVRAAVALRSALARQGTTVVDAKATRARIEEYLRRDGEDLAVYEQRLAQAEQALAALNQERSIDILEGLILSLAKDPSFTTQKQELLERARLKLASRLIGLAGQGESGKAETPLGARARGILVDALRANPKLAPSRDEYPPRFHVALDAARADLVHLGTGGIIVDSRPQKAHVFMEGRDVGLTPLSLGTDVLAKGEYRMWVELDGVRSVPRKATVSEKAETHFVDLAFEGALWAEGPGLRPIKDGVIDEEVARKIGAFLGVDTLLLVGRWNYEGEGEFLWGAAFDVSEGARERHGVVRLDDRNTLDLAADGLAGFLGRGDRENVESKPLPPTVLPDRPPSGQVGALTSSGPRLSVTSSGEEIPWVPIGIAAGSVAALALIGGVVVAVLASQPVDAVVVTARGIDE